MTLGAISQALFSILIRHGEYVVFLFLIVVVGFWEFSWIFSRIRLQRCLWSYSAWGWFTSLAVSPHVGSGLFCYILTMCCPLSYRFLGFCWNSRIWPHVFNSLVTCKPELWLHVQFHMHCVAISLWACGIAFFGFWLLGSEGSYWRCFAYPTTKDVEVIIQPGVGSHAPQWGLVFSLLVLLSLDLFLLPLSDESLLITMCGLPRSHPTRKCDIILFYVYRFVSTCSVNQPGRVYNEVGFGEPCGRTLKFKIQNVDSRKVKVELLWPRSMVLSFDLKKHTCMSYNFMCRRWSVAAQVDGRVGLLVQFSGAERGASGGLPNPNVNFLFPPSKSHSRCVLLFFIPLQPPSFTSSKRKNAVCMRKLKECFLYYYMAFVTCFQISVESCVFHLW